jgi:replicative DNA helicase
MGEIMIDQKQFERAVLSAIIQKNDIYDLIQMRIKDFQDIDYRKIYQAIGALIEEAKPIDKISILETTNRAYYRPLGAIIAGLDLPTAGNVAYYAKGLKDNTLRRELRDFAIGLQEALKNGDDIEDIQEKLEKDLTEITTKQSNEIKQLKYFMQTAIDQLQEQHKNKGKLSGIDTGFDGLNKLTNGWQPGTLNIIGARPAIGKTALAVTMAQKATKANHIVGIFSCEMSGGKLAYRLMSGIGHVNIINMGSGYMNDGDFDKLITAGNKMNELELYIDDTPNPTLAHIKSNARQMKRKGIEIIFIDYLTLIKHGALSTPRPERVGEISKQLKQLARELNIPIVLLSQLNRGAEGREPSLDNLRQTGELEEDADMVLFLHRDRDAGDGKTNVIIAKHRDGATGRFEILFLPQYVRFENKGFE